jgi:hypothetical protein
MGAECRNWQLMTFPHSPRTGVIGRPELPARFGEHAEIVISGDETLLQDDIPEKLRAQKIMIVRPDSTHAKAISIVESRLPSSNLGIGAPITGHPANDSEKGKPYPLYTEYVEGRLGKDAYANSKHWNTALWIYDTYSTAMLPDRSLGPLHWFSSGADKDIDQDTPCCSMENIVPPSTVSVLNILAALKRVEQSRLKKQGYKNKTVGTHEASSSKDPRLPTGVEVRCDASKKLRLLQIGMRGLWKPVKQAVIDQADTYRAVRTQSVIWSPASTAAPMTASFVFPQPHTNALAAPSRYKFDASALKSALHRS